MRKNNQNGKVLDKFYYTSYEIKGLNLDRLVEVFKRRGVGLYDIKKFGNKRLIFTACAQDNEKIFAISKELCYNIKKLRDGGRYYPLVYLFKNIGLVVGAIIFIVVSVMANDLVLGVSFSGSGAEYRREVSDLLQRKGIVKFSKFSDFDLKVLSSEILGANEHLSFATCQKQGNTLKITLAISGDQTERLTGTAKSLVADCDGVVESVKTYRGTSLVKAGDKVKSGDLLVSNVVVVSEETTIEVGVIAQVSLAVDYAQTFTSPHGDAENEAIAFALAKAQDKAIISSTVSKEFDGQEYIYKVTLTCRRILFAG